jgi:hypothetical protein
LPQGFVNIFNMGDTTRAFFEQSENLVRMLGTPFDPDALSPSIRKSN